MLDEFEFEYTVEDFDGDTSIAKILIQIQDSGFVITPPTDIENNEDTRFLLDFNFFAADVEQSENVVMLAIDATTTDGGRLFFKPIGGTEIELVDDGGMYRLLPNQN